MPAEIFSLYLPNLLLILSVFVVGAASPGPATLMIMNVAAREGRERLETWVTDCTGHMGNTSRFGGRLRCHGRNNRKWTRGYALLLAGLKESR
jgi:hypothetical protein